MIPESAMAGLRNLVNQVKQEQDRQEKSKQEPRIFAAARRRHDQLRASQEQKPVPNEKIREQLRPVLLKLLQENGIAFEK